MDFTFCLDCAVHSCTSCWSMSWVILESHRFSCVTVHWAVQKTHEWHIPEMQSGAEGLMFWISPTCFWHTQCSCYTTMVSSIKTKSCKIWLNSRFNRDAEPTLETYTILWGNETTRKKWLSVELDLVWGCSRIHSLKKWAKKILQNISKSCAELLNKVFTPLNGWEERWRYSLQYKFPLCKSPRIYYSEVEMNVPSPVWGARNYHVLLIVSSRILMTHFFVLIRHINGNKISRCTDNPFYKANDLLHHREYSQCSYWF